MLKLNASYSKKVPAEGEYSSQSFYASIEVELPDGLSQEQLQGKIHETFELVKSSVEAELHQKRPENSVPFVSREAVKMPSQPTYTASSPNEIPASPKQIKYLLDLARQRGITPQQIAAQCQVAKLEILSKKQCSDLINSWRRVA